MVRAQRSYKQYSALRDVEVVGSSPATGIFMIIRKPIQKDKAGLAKLYVQFWQAHPNKDPLIAIKKRPTPKNQIRAAERDLRNRNIHLFIAEDKGKVAGFIELLIKKNHKIFKVKRFGYINSLVIDKRYRKKGICRLLVKKAMGFFRQKKIRYVRTNVYFSNRTAIKTWPKMKFKPESMFMIKKP